MTFCNPSPPLADRDCQGAPHLSFEKEKSSSLSSHQVGLITHLFLRSTHELLHSVFLINSEAVTNHEGVRLSAVGTVNDILSWSAPHNLCQTLRYHTRFQRERGAQLLTNSVTLRYHTQSSEGVWRDVACSNGHR